MLRNFDYLIMALLLVNIFFSVFIMLYYKRREYESGIEVQEPSKTPVEVEILEFQERIQNMKEELATTEYFSGVPLFTPKADKYDEKSGIEVITPEMEMALEKRLKR